MNILADVLVNLAVVIITVWQMVIGFAAVMNFSRVRDVYGLTPTQKAVGYPALAVYYTLDLVLRLTLFLPMDRPRFHWTTFHGYRFPVPETVSRLLEREAREGDGWRNSVAVWLRNDLLAAFDSSGGHGDPGRKK